MKKSLLCGVAFALAAGPSLAADLPARQVRPPVVAPVVYSYDWSGIYIGAHAGGGWGQKCFTFAGANEGCHDVNGWLGGGQVGFNWQGGPLVLGLEFSGSASWFTGSHNAVLDPADTYRTRVDSIFLLTGRAGWAFDRVLLYATGGGAAVRDRFEYVAAGVGTATARDTRWGWTLGGGLEFGLTPNWSVAAQYNYIDLGRRDATFSGGGVATFTDSIGQHLHVATLRLNYRFGGPVSARY